MFLDREKSRLQKFLDTHQPLPDYRLETKKILSVIHPTSLIKDINAEVHDLSLHDVYTCISFIKELGG